MPQASRKKDAQSLNTILSGSVNDVIITIHDLVLVRNKTRDEMGGAMIYHHDTKTLESIDGANYTFDDIYDMYRWDNKRDLAVWRDLREEE